MKLLYPASSHSHLPLKIARHSPCTACNSCSGFHPPQNVDVARDDQLHPESSLGDLGQYGSDDDDGGADYLETCDCRHVVRDHGADESELGAEEFARRGRIAIHLDQLLQDVGKLLDFEYTDDNISSLRQRMRLPVSLMGPVLDSFSPPGPPLSPASSILSDVPQPPSKKRRISSSSLSAADDDDDEDDEEDKPLAARLSATLNSAATSSTDRPEKTARVAPLQRSGKTKTNMKSKAQTAPASMPPPTGQAQVEMNAKTNGINGHGTKVKVEDRMDEGQLTRLATGVTVDSGGRASPAPTKTEKPATVEMRRGVIQITAVENDRLPRSLIILTNLKTLFQKQLPNMPREYIARLVYDETSKSLAIIKRGYKVVGGICYRPFPHRGFAEIVFFATSSVDQEKGYGGVLMDHFKAHIRRTYPSMMHFLTYADNYAVGYFKKQGFTKDITLDRSIWAGYIKDYQGATILQCTMIPKVNYLEKAGLIAQQREAVLTKIRLMSKSHIVYPGLPQFQEGAGPDVVVDPQDVQGLRESGWTPTTTPHVRGAPRNAEHAAMERLLSDLRTHPQAWAFQTPVDGDDVRDYYEVIRRPMDFSTMEHKLETNQYRTLETFINDAQLIFDNCRIYNPENTIYARNATKLEKFLKDQLADHVKTEE